MTGNDALYALLARIGASHNGAAFFSAAELRDWPKAALAAFKKAELLTQAAPAMGVICDGCERRCFMPVEIAVGPGRSTAFVVCDKRDDINRVSVPLDRLERWQASGEAVAVFLAVTLGIVRSAGTTTQGKRWDVGMLRGRRAAHLMLTNADALTLELAGHAVPLFEVLTMKGGRLELRRQTLIDCIDHPVAGGGSHKSAAERGARVVKMVNAIGVKAAAKKEGVSPTRIKQITAAHRKRSSANKIV